MENLSLTDLIIAEHNEREKAKAAVKNKPFNAPCYDKAMEFRAEFLARTKDLSQGEIAGIIEKAYGA
jgi:hypothetical protein